MNQALGIWFRHLVQEDENRGISVALSDERSLVEGTQ